MDNISKNEIINFYQDMGLPTQSYLRNGRIRNIYDILGIRPKLKDNGDREITPYEILKVPPQMVMGKEVPIVFAIKNRVGKIGKYDGDDLVYTYQSRKVKKELTLLQTLRSNYKKALFDGDDALAYRILQMYDKLTGGKSKEFLDSFYDYTKFYRRMKKQLIIDIFAHLFLMQQQKIEQPKFVSVKTGVLSRKRSIRPYRNRVFYGEPNITEEQYEAELEERRRAQLELNKRTQNETLQKESRKNENGFWFIFSPRNTKKGEKRTNYEYDVEVKNKNKSKRKRFFNWEKIKKLLGAGQDKNQNAPVDYNALAKEFTPEEIQTQLGNPDLTQEQRNYLKALDYDINDLNKQNKEFNGLNSNLKKEDKVKEKQRESEPALERRFDYD